jgi:hypothetical protein
MRVDAKNPLSKHLRAPKSERAREDGEPHDSGRHLPRRERSKSFARDLLQQSRELLDRIDTYLIGGGSLDRGVCELKLRNEAKKHRVFNKWIIPG